MAYRLSRRFRKRARKHVYFAEAQNPQMRQLVTRIAECLLYRKFFQRQLEALTTGHINQCSKFHIGRIIIDFTERRFDWTLRTDHITIFPHKVFPVFFKYRIKRSDLSLPDTASRVCLCFHRRKLRTIAARSCLRKLVQYGIGCLQELTVLQNTLCAQFRVSQCQIDCQLGKISLLRFLFDPTMSFDSCFPAFRRM